MRRLGLLIFFALMTGIACSEEPAAPPAEPKLPADVEALSPEMQQRIELLKGAAEKFRGLPLKQKKLAVGQKDREALKKKVLEMFAEELPKDVLLPMERSLKNFDLIPQAMELGKYYPELLTSQIGGYYDPKHKYLVLVKDGGGILGPEMTKKMGKEVADKMEETVLVHEITHALQDQHFELEKYGHDKPLSDAAAAKLALIEGDATLVMYGYMLGVPMERLPMADASLDMFASDPAKMAAMMPEMPGAKEMMAAPAYIRDNLIFSYIQGLGFCIQVRKAGGQKLLDYAFAKDPPQSTEQILHPEKWIGKRDDPIEITLPELTALAGWKKASEGNWGEFNTRLLLCEKLGQAVRKQAATAAAGWGGDRFQLFEKEGKEVLVWLTAWDTPQDAGEFYDLSEQAFKQGWQMALQAVHEDKGASRVILVRGELPKESFDQIKEICFALKLARPANKALDLTALGITDADKPGMLSMAEMTRMLNDPIVKKMMGMGLGGGDGELDLGKLLDDPKMQDMVKEMGEKMYGEGMGDAMGELMKNPAVKKMMEDMLKQPAAPQGKAEGGTYENKALGLQLKAPTGDAWKINDNPPPSPMGPKPLVEISGPDGAKVILLLQSLPIPVSIEQIGPMLEMGPQMQFQNYKKVKAGFVKSGEQKGYELEYTANAMGENVHILQRVFMRDGKMLMAVGNAAPDKWEQHGAVIRGALDSLALTAPEKKDAPKPEPKEDNVLKE